MMRKKLRMNKFIVARAKRRFKPVPKSKRTSSGRLVQMRRPSQRQL
jgi:hypothetical protein